MTTPAPGGSAEAYAANILNLIAISHTKANASGTGTSSTADPLEIGGNPPASVFGGSQTGAGSNHGALLDTGPSTQFRLALTPWNATNTEANGTNTASAISDILLLDLGDPTTATSASVRVLQSKSDATWTNGASTGNSSSDGAIVNLGGPSGLTIDLLHADASSSGTGTSYLLSLNGNQIGSSSQVNGQCSINLPGLLSLICLNASGGVGSELSSVVTATLGGSTPVDLITTKSTSAPSSAPTVSSNSGSGAQTGPAGNSGGAAPAAKKAAARQSGALPFTGLDVTGLIGLALALGLAGTGMIWWMRRIRPTAAL